MHDIFVNVKVITFYFGDEQIVVLKDGAQKILLNNGSMYYYYHHCKWQTLFTVK